jgi:hypothetical protein
MLVWGQVDLAMVQDSVSNPTIGKMRMQFWRDAVKGITDVCAYAHAHTYVRGMWVEGRY